MHSTRTYATEVRVNRENLKGYHLSDGAYFLMQRGDEYHGIQPVWDWRKLPGITCRDTDDPYPYGREVEPSGSTAFVGGVSDGKVGVAAMDYAKDGVSARKAWFFTDTGWVCLGAGISAETNDSVTTSVNQCLLKTEVVVLQNGETEELDTGKLEASDLRASLHDGVGYYLLGPHSVVLKAAEQRGKWTDIEEASSNHDAVTEKVFSLWVDHGPRPQNASYAYLVTPGLDGSRFRSLAEDLPTQVVVNAPEQQAVHTPGEGRVQVAFWAPGSVHVPGEPEVAVDAPCLLMLRREGDRVLLSVADPTQGLEQIEVTLGGEYDGEGCVAADEGTRVTVDVPRGALAGQTAVTELRRR